MSKRGVEETDLMLDEDPNQIGLDLLSCIQSQEIEKVMLLLQGGAPAHYQETENGTSALMVAAASGNIPMIKLLLESGAPWNAIDRQGKSAGDYAVDGGSQEAIDTLVTAGVTAELLFGAMDRGAKKTPTINSSLSPGSPMSNNSTYDAHFPAPPGQYLEDRGVRYDGDKLLDSADDAVMMEWETPLMEAHADILLGDNLHLFGDLVSSLSVELCSLVSTPLNSGQSPIIPPSPSSSALAESPQQQGGVGGGGGVTSSMHRRSVLNIGFGMGIIDNALQRRTPGHHTIVEAHPAVFQQMIDLGWDKKPNVSIVFGKWQDVIHTIGKFDSVFFDTYGERYSDMQHFHEILPQIIHPKVACELVKIELSALGFETIFIPIQIQLDEKTWNGVTRKYWQRDTYYLPVSVLATTPH